MTAWFTALYGLSERWQQLGRSTNSTPPTKLQISNDQPHQSGSTTTWCYGVVIVWTFRHRENQKRWISSRNWRGWSPGRIVIAVLHRIHNSLSIKPIQPTNQPTNQTTNQPTNQSINQPTNQLTNQPISQPTNQPISQPTNQSTNQLTKQSINQPTNQTTNLLTNQSTNQNNQSTNILTNQSTN
jgi:hypothetical protein